MMHYKHDLLSKIAQCFLEIALSIGCHTYIIVTVPRSAVSGCELAKLYQDINRNKINVRVVDNEFGGLYVRLLLLCWLW